MCEVCGGPIRRDNKYGVCKRTSACRSENSRRSYYVDVEASRERQRTHRRDHPGLHNGYAKQWRDKNPELVALKCARQRARNADVPFELTLETLPPVPEVCPVFGLPLQRQVGRRAANSPSLDRIIPDLGYVPGNVQWLSNRANEMKRDASPEELRQFAEWVLKTSD